MIDFAKVNVSVNRWIFMYMGITACTLNSNSFKVSIVMCSFDSSIRKVLKFPWNGKWSVIFVGIVDVAPERIELNWARNGIFADIDCCSQLLICVMAPSMELASSTQTSCSRWTWSDQDGAKQPPTWWRSVWQQGIQYQGCFHADLGQELSW